MRSKIKNKDFHKYDWQSQNFQTSEMKNEARYKDVTHSTNMKMTKHIQYDKNRNILNRVFYIIMFIRQKLVFIFIVYETIIPSASKSGNNSAFLTIKNS